MFEKLVQQIVQDTAVDLNQAFDRNFESKSFFNKKWKNTRYPNRRGSLMMRSGKLRRSIKSSTANGVIRWKSAMPYASIHNEGGEIKVTAKMKRFFWAMHYKSSNAVLYNVRSKKQANTQRNRKLNEEALKWKALALQKVGTVMTIEQRQFIGWHPQVDYMVKKIVNNNLAEVNKAIINKLK